MHTERAVVIALTGMSVKGEPAVAQRIGFALDEWKLVLLVLADPVTIYQACMASHERVISIGLGAIRAKQLPSS